jgi:hypothetical protein
MNRVRIMVVALAACAVIAPGLAFTVTQVSAASPAASHPHAIEAQGTASPQGLYLFDD